MSFGLERFVLGVSRASRARRPPGFGSPLRLGSCRRSPTRRSLLTIGSAILRRSSPVRRSGRTRRSRWLRDPSATASRTSSRDGRSFTEGERCRSEIRCAGQRDDFVLTSQGTQCAETMGGVNVYRLNGLPLLVGVLALSQESFMAPARRPCAALLCPGSGRSGF
jgi:hypothetical protein